MLDEKMFEISKNPELKSLENIPTQTPLVVEKKEVTTGYIKDKKTVENMSFINHNKISNVLSQIKKINTKEVSISGKQNEKNERSNIILSLIKDKREVSIKDISITLTDCSEKTIQRELNTLVSKGQIKKTGSKRWSKYHAI